MGDVGVKLELGLGLVYRVSVIAQASLAHIVCPSCLGRPQCVRRFGRQTIWTTDVWATCFERLGDTLFEDGWMADHGEA